MSETFGDRPVCAADRAVEEARWTGTAGLRDAARPVAAASGEIGPDGDLLPAGVSRETPAAAPPPAAPSAWARVGVVLMGFSLLLWVALPAVPFLPLSAAARGVTATALIVVAEVAFWAGAALAGPAAARRMRSWWRRPRPPGRAVDPSRPERQS